MKKPNTTRSVSARVARIMKNSKIVFLTLTVATVGMATKADMLSGDVSFFVLNNSSTITFDGSSLQLMGTLSAINQGSNLTVPLFSTVTPYTGTLTGLSATQTPEYVPDYLDFAGYSFTLTSISETVAAGDVQVLGSGILTDTSNALTPSTATISFSSSASSPTGSFSGSIFANGVAPTPVPEPTTLALAGIGGLASLVAMRRRK